MYEILTNEKGQRWYRLGTSAMWTHSEGAEHMHQCCQNYNNLNPVSLRDKKGKWSIGWLCDVCQSVSDITFDTRLSNPIPRYARAISSKDMRTLYAGYITHDKMDIIQLRNLQNGVPLLDDARREAVDDDRMSALGFEGMCPNCGFNAKEGTITADGSPCYQCAQCGSVYRWLQQNGNVIGSVKYAGATSFMTKEHEDSNDMNGYELPEENEESIKLPNLDTDGDDEIIVVENAPATEAGSHPFDADTDSVDIDTNTQLNAVMEDDRSSMLMEQSDFNEDIVATLKEQERVSPVIPASEYNEASTGDYKGVEITDDLIITAQSETPTQVVSESEPEDGNLHRSLFMHDVESAKAAVPDYDGKLGRLVENYIQANTPTPAPNEDEDQPIAVDGISGQVRPDIGLTLDPMPDMGDEVEREPMPTVASWHGDIPCVQLTIAHTSNEAEQTGVLCDYRRYVSTHYNLYGDHVETSIVKIPAAIVQERMFMMETNRKKILPYVPDIFLINRSNLNQLQEDELVSFLHYGISVDGSMHTAIFIELNEIVNCGIHIVASRRK